jgi:hypothetical protein
MHTYTWFQRTFSHFTYSLYALYLEHFEQVVTICHHQSVFLVSPHIRQLNTRREDVQIGLEET